MSQTSFPVPAIRLSPALLEEARLLKDANRYSEAYYLYQLLCLIDPSDNGLMLEWAECKLHCGQEKDALSELKLLLDLQPRWHEPSALLADYYAKRKDFRSAYHYIRQAIRLSGFRVSRYMELAASYAPALGKHEEAMHLIQAALELHPQQPAYHYRKALLHFTSNQFETAIDSLNEAISLKNDYREAFLLRAACKRELLDELGADQDRSQAARAGDEENLIEC